LPHFDTHLGANSTGGRGTAFEWQRSRSNSRVDAKLLAGLTDRFSGGKLTSSGYVYFVVVVVVVVDLPFYFFSISQSTIDIFISFPAVRQGASGSGEVEARLAAARPRTEH
jgi:hypothetical protein